MVSYASRVSTIEINMITALVMLPTGHTQAKTGEPNKALSLDLCKLNNEC